MLAHGTRFLNPPLWVDSHGNCRLSRWAFCSIVREISLALAARLQAKKVVPEGAHHRQPDAICLLGVRQTCLPGKSPYLEAGGHERV